jgi:hypothetical protein
MYYGELFRASFEEMLCRRGTAIVLLALLAAYLFLLSAILFAAFIRLLGRQESARPK